jgi:gas vesicle protein
MEDDKRFSFFFLGLGIGVAVGMLFAPKSGAETRDLIREKADEGKEYLKRRSEELRESAVDAVERGKTAVQRRRENLAAAMDAGLSTYREKVTASAPAAPAGNEEMIEGI